jgi:CheY-like chemotaxis protein
VAAERAVSFNDGLHGLRILLVEDDPEYRAGLSLLLERAGAVVTAVGSAHDALEALELGRPDVLLCDIGLPDEDGYALMRKVRALDPDRGGKVPAAAVTARSSQDDRRDALDAGFWAHLPKPVEVPKLLATVANLGRAGSIPGY